VLDPDVVAGLDAALASDDQQRLERYPGRRRARQPVHTVYVPADRFGLGTVSEWGLAALRALEEYGPLPEPVAEMSLLVKAKLLGEPIEDLRIDFEDGYGNRSDAEEDADAVAAAESLSSLLGIKGAPAFCGIRFKSLEAGSRHRGIRTVDVFFDSLLGSGSRLPSGFRLTLPKVTSVAQVLAMVSLCEALESNYGIDRLRFELQVETPQAILDASGAALIAPMIHAAGSRCAGVHYGTYDYSESVGIAAGYQSMEHPAADYAKAVMQVAAAGTGVPVSDGSTNVLPVGSPAAVREAWALHARLVRRSLERGFYQGWDLHPAQLPTRFAATFSFFRDGYALAGSRLRAYLDRAQAGFLDEPATARAMVDYLIRGRDCGAVTETELLEVAGLDRAGLMALLNEQ
jgi:hypothetical protein